jgi:hypothetical protein
MWKKWMWSIHKQRFFEQDRFIEIDYVSYSEGMKELDFFPLFLLFR